MALNETNWLFIGVNVVGWAFSAGVLVTTTRFIRERLKDGDKKMEQHETDIKQLDHRVTRIETEHYVFHKRSKETPAV